MGEREINRNTVEHMAGALKEHEAQRGNYLTADQAREQAADVARETDAKKEAGAMRNKRKRKAEPVIERRIAKPGRVFVDFGRKG